MSILVVIGRIYRYQLKCNYEDEDEDDDKDHDELLLWDGCSTKDV